MGENGVARAERVRSLLIEMLSCVRHSQDTPLYFGIDGQRIVASALSSIEADCVEAESLREYPGEVMERIEGLVREALGASHHALDSAAERADSRPLPARLVFWMEGAHDRMRAVHPMALDILGLLVEGETSREVSERLALGLRLIQRICADMRKAW